MMRMSRLRGENDTPICGECHVPVVLYCKDDMHGLSYFSRSVISFVHSDATQRLGEGSATYDIVVWCDIDQGAGVV